VKEKSRYLMTLYFIMTMEDSLLLNVQF